MDAAKARQAPDPGRRPSSPDDGMLAPARERAPEGMLRGLQASAGNRAVAQLLAGHRRAGVQRQDERDKPPTTGGQGPSLTMPSLVPPLGGGTGPLGPVGGFGAGPMGPFGPMGPGPFGPFGPMGPIGIPPVMWFPPLTLGGGTPAGPSFGRSIGADLEAPALPSTPAPRTFTADPTATLPAKEAAPDLSMIPSDKPWWDDKDAQALGERLADAYASRGLTSGAKVDKATKLAELQSDFDQVVQGWFGRTKYGRWSSLPTTLAAMLQRRRTEILNHEKAVDARLKKDDRRTAADLDAAVEAQMQKVRFDMVEDVRLQVAIGTWGWMKERREKLDFDTVKQTVSGPRASLTELLTDDEQRKVVHDILVAKGKELTAAEVTRTHEAAQRKADAAAKKAGKPSTPLTDDEKAAAVAQAEHDRVQANWAGELRTAMIKARTTKDAADLVLPTTADVKGWSVGKTRIHKDIVALLKVLETEYPAGFDAGTYSMNVEGDHASSGFEGRFRSLDMYPKGGGSRVHAPFGQIGFFDQQIAFDFGRAIDRAVGSKGSFQILYNDFAVARELNKVLKHGRVFNIDNVVADKGGAANLNWHGPLVTHFHVDFAI